MVSVAYHIIIRAYAFQVFAIDNLAVADVLTEGVDELDLPSIVGYWGVKFYDVFNVAPCTLAVQHSQFIINDLEFLLLRCFFSYRDSNFHIWHRAIIIVGLVNLVSEKTWKMSVRQSPAIIVKKQKIECKLQSTKR